MLGGSSGKGGGNCSLPHLFCKNVKFMGTASGYPNVFWPPGCSLGFNILNSPPSTTQSSIRKNYFFKEPVEGVAMVKILLGQIFDIWLAFKNQIFIIFVVYLNIPASWTQIRKITCFSLFVPIQYIWHFLNKFKVLLMFYILVVHT